MEAVGRVSSSVAHCCHSTSEHQGMAMVDTKGPGTASAGFRSIASLTWREWEKGSKDKFIWLWRFVI